MISKEHALRAEIIIAVLVITVMGFGLFRPSSTGFVPANVQHEPLGISIEKSQLYRMVFDNDTNIQSFGVSGSVYGNGSAYIFLDNKAGQRLLVYTNVKNPANMTGASLITGLATANIEPGPVIGEHVPLGADEETTNGVFINECIETCTTPMDFVGKEYDIIFLVQPGVSLKVDEIIYIAE